MRLLHTTTLSFREFSDAQNPDYAILSHRWSDSEIPYQDLRDGHNCLGKGYDKVRYSCWYAKSRGLDWIWIDTCCIDKTSSAELTETINSMWAWYGRAIECYAYLPDLPEWLQRSAGIWTSNDRSSRRLTPRALDALAKSEWFTRGWTLQELLAPEHVIFLNAHWRPFLATKAEIASDLCAITGICVRYLCSPHRISEASIAMRMSWVSRRLTSRVEDTAYCMLGIFNVNMPLLYGEGSKAFMRLQLEIIKKPDDNSIFAWTSAIDSRGLLAMWPTAFASSGSIVHFDISNDHRFPYAMTNRGLELRLAVDTAVAPPGRESSELHLEAQWRGGMTQQPLLVNVPLDKKSSRSFQLVCGSCDHVNMNHVSTEQLKDIAQRNVISISMTRAGSGWKRANCGRLEMSGTYVVSLESAHTIYYVPQDGL